MAYDHKVRIIGGLFKGRRLEVLDHDGLRPTTDRVRETVFNWIGNKVQGAKVLDLFTGSGALGLEALSRGAQDVTLVDLNIANVSLLKQEIKGLPNLQGASVQIIHQDALAFLKNCNQQYDLIFLDPPFNSNLLENAVELIVENNIITEQGLIYIEMGTAKKKDLFGINLIREGNAGISYFGLYQKSFLF